MVLSDMSCHERIPHDGPWANSKHKNPEKHLHFIVGPMKDSQLEKKIPGTKKVFQSFIRFEQHGKQRLEQKDKHRSRGDNQTEAEFTNPCERQVFGMCGGIVQNIRGHTQDDFVPVFLSVL